MGTMKKKKNKKRMAFSYEPKEKAKLQQIFKSKKRTTSSLSDYGIECKTQAERIVKYIKDFGSITTRDAFDDLGITRLASRICELQTIFKIHRCSERRKNRYGEWTRFTRYAFDEKFLIQKGEQK